MNKQILITGGSGFIGTNLVNYLLKKNYFITNIDKQSYASTPENFKLKNKKYSFYKVNISNQKKIEKILLKNFSIIIHLAAESHVDRSIDNPKKFIKSNINSTLNLYSSILKLRKNKKIKNPNIIHISTDEVYGSIEKGSFSESSSLCTSSPYSASKASCDHIAESFRTTFDLSICILRMTNNYGPFQFIEKFIPTIITKILENKKIPLYGNGNNEREWIFVEDTCRAIEQVVKKFKNKKIFNVGSGERIQNRVVVNKIINKFKIKNLKKLIMKVKDRPGHDLRYALNSNNFLKDYNWKPKYKFTIGIRKTIKWFIDNPEWINYCKKKYKGKRIGVG